MGNAISIAAKVESLLLRVVTMVIFRSFTIIFWQLAIALLHHIHDNLTCRAIACRIIGGQ